MIEIPLVDLEETVKSLIGKQNLIALEQDTAKGGYGFLYIDCSTTVDITVKIHYNALKACNLASITRVRAMGSTGVIRSSAMFGISKAFLCTPRVKIKLEWEKP